MTDELVPISAVICTLNEAEKIGRALRSLAWTAEVVVVDSGSTDGTVEIARGAGARVFEHEWLGFSAQKNFAASLARNDWILSIDADEVVTPQLAGAIREVIDGVPRSTQSFSVDRRNDFLGKMLPNSARSANRLNYVRVYNRTTASWDESVEVHELVKTPEKPQPIRGQLLHINDLSVDGLVALFNRYATAEAAALVAAGRRATVLDLTARPIARFVWHFLIKGEWRLGRRGAAHAGIKALSDFIRYAKLLENELRVSSSLTVEEKAA
ncbi:glycosyltransferase family 2 protein [Cellulomonas marina]|uniref:glycosyltransferase family 2 protein n=1 Tax=Cellulomonas marina TaxID=988821 RepID=UPI000B7F74CA|nr:glycosyltransferase family 2 protein [Cellulomonas marina]GIG29373.1 glycosyl transferase family 2 [Cellulomonas marina]